MQLTAAGSSVEFVGFLAPFGNQMTGAFTRFSIVFSAEEDGRIKVSGAFDATGLRESATRETIMSRDFLWAERYPEINIEAFAAKRDFHSHGPDRVLIIAPASVELRGVTRRETITFEFSCGEVEDCPYSQLRVSGAMETNRRDYGMTSLPIVRDRVEIRLSGVAAGTLAGD